MVSRWRLSQILFVLVVGCLIGIGLMAYLHSLALNKYWPVGVDAYHIWVATGAVWRGESPYTESVKSTAQQLIYGQITVRDPNIFKIYYPAYIAIVMFPLSFLPVTWAAVTWSGLMWGILFTLVVLWSWRLYPPLAPWLWGLVLLTGIFYRPAILAAINGQYALFTLACGAFSWWLIQRRRDGLAGSILALTMIKPSVGLFLPAILLLWALRWKHWRVIAGFSLALFSLVAIPMLKIGWWIPDFVGQMFAYSRDVGGGAWSPGEIATPFGILWLSTTLVLCGIGIYRLWHEVAFPWLAMLGAVNLNLLVTPHVVEYDLTVLLIVLFWLGNEWRTRRWGLLGWSILVWMPWLSWLAVIWRGQTIDAWWNAIWQFYPSLLLGFVLAWLLYERASRPQPALRMSNLDVTASR